MEKIISNLRSRGFKTNVVTKFDEAMEFIRQLIPENAVVAIGNSVSSKIKESILQLKSRNSKIFESWDGSPDYNRSIDNFDPAPRPDIFISNSAYITEEGDLLVKDAIHQNPERLPKNTIWIASMHHPSDPGVIPGNNAAQNLHPDNDHTVILIPAE